MRNLAALEWFVARLVVLGGCAIVATGLSRMSRPPVPVESDVLFAELVTDAEVTTYKKAILEAAAVKSQRCTRPVLRGEVKPGPAQPDALAFNDAKSQLGSCVTGWRAVISFTERTPEKLAVLEKCGAQLEAAMRAAIAHEDACSPYGLGGPEETEMGIAMHVGQAVGERARVIADAGDVQGAMWLLLEVMRFGQDYARGRTDVLSAMIGTAIVGKALDHANAVLDKGTPTNIDELASAVDNLLASEPSFGEAAASDGIRVALDWSLPALEPATWVPPGGRRRNQSRPADNDPLARGRAIDLLVFSTTSPARIAQVCGVDASLAQCRRGLAGALGVTPSDGTTRTIVRQALVETQMGGYFATWPDYINKRAVSHGALIALRLRLAIAKTGCADRAALAKLASTPTLGDVMRLDYVGDELVISPPAWTSTSDSPQRIRCARPPTEVPVKRPPTEVPAK